jgi:hypothetical protein
MVMIRDHTISIGFSEKIVCDSEKHDVSAN